MVLLPAQNSPILSPLNVLPVRQLHRYNIGYGTKDGLSGQLSTLQSSRVEALSLLAGAIVVIAGSKVRGEFNLQSDNHGKPVYKKNGQAVDRV